LRRVWRLRILIVIPLAVSAWAASPAESLAWSHGCGGPSATPPDFVGLVEDHSGITGARVKIEWSNSIAPVLCTTSGGASYSSTWVAIGNRQSGNDIYQVGIDTCQGAACAPTSGPDNTPYYFVAKGRGYSDVCGTAVAPEPVETAQGLARAGSLWYQIYMPNSTTFQTRIGGATAGVSMSTYWTGRCWGGVGTAQYLNEVYDIFDQTAGSTADTQFWSSGTWTNSSGTLVSINRAFSSHCDAADRTSMACAVASNLHDAWYTHDTRQ
jgi:hypothetical protein